MKRIFLGLLLLGLTIPNLGCQNCLSRCRGARCRGEVASSPFRFPRFGKNEPAAMPAPPPGYQAGPACNQGCNQPGYAYSKVVPNGVVMSGDDIPPNAIITDSYESSPYEEGFEIRERPANPSIHDGAVITVPGPEIGPLPSKP